MLRKFAGYSALERRLVLKAWCTVCSVRLLLWVMPYRWIERWLMRPPAALPTSTPPAEIALAVTRASTLVPYASCLTQALAGGFLLRRAGRHAVIHFGVAKADARFKAHAWLESDGGIVIGGREAAAYLPLTRPLEPR